MPGDPLKPRIDNSLPPPLHDIDAYKFQRFAVDLLAHEPTIAVAEEYGVQGQGDKGVDVLARRSSGDGHEVASCKRWEKATASKVREASDEFLDYWDVQWKSHSVRRFVLFTAAQNTARTDIQDQITKEIDRFKAYGIAYELWAPRAETQSGP